MVVAEAVTLEVPANLAVAEGKLQQAQQPRIAITSPRRILPNRVAKRMQGSLLVSTAGCVSIAVVCLGNGDVNIYRVCDGKCIPWLAVRDSLMMQKHLQQKGKRLYALRSFKQGEYIGRYTGRLVAHEQDAASLSNSSNKLLTMSGIVVDGAQPLQSPAEQLADFGVVLQDPKDWPHPGMYHFMANDARNTPMENNSLVDLEGFMLMTEHVKAVYSDEAPPHKNAESELFWSYGDAYWTVHA